MSAPIGTPSKSGRAKAATHHRIIRLTSYSVAAVLSLVMISAVVPPIVADQSDRAVVNAPVILLTTPIAGEVSSIAIRLGEQIDKGLPVAHILNDRIDHATLISLEEKAASIRERIQATKRKHDSDIDYLAVLDTEIAQQSRQLARQFNGQIAELRARVAEIQAGGREKKALVDRQNSMISRAAASADMVKPTTEQFEAANHRADAEKAKLDQKIAQFEALREGIYVGVDLAPIAELEQKRKDMMLDAKRMAIEENELLASVTDRERLIDAERKRLDSLARADIVTPTNGEILGMSASQGRYVNAGDTLATLVDCDKAFVVAIFSYRQGQDLKIGSRVRVDGAQHFTHGVITEVLPKTSDKVDERFAIPFPQTERRELYVMVKPEWDAPATTPDPISDGLPQAGDERHGMTRCGVGQWVTVTRENGWVPSISVVWRKMQNTAAAAMPPGIQPANATRGTP